MSYLKFDLRRVRNTVSAMALAAGFLAGGAAHAAYQETRVHHTYQPGSIFVMSVFWVTPTGVAEDVANANGRCEVQFYLIDALGHRGGLIPSHRFQQSNAFCNRAEDGAYEAGLAVWETQSTAASMRAARNTGRRIPIRPVASETGGLIAAAAAETGGVIAAAPTSTDTKEILVRRRYADRGTFSIAYYWIAPSFTNENGDHPDGYCWAVPVIQVGDAEPVRRDDSGKVVSNIACARNPFGVFTPEWVDWDIIPNPNAQEERDSDRQAPPRCGAYFGCRTPQPPSRNEEQSVASATRATTAAASVAAARPANDIPPDVWLDQGQQVTISGDEHYGSLAIFDEARVTIEEPGLLFVEAGVGVFNSELTIDGILAAQSLDIIDGRVIISETGLYFDHASTYPGGVMNDNGLLEVRGELVTDWFLQIGGLTHITETGFYFDFDGALIEGGLLQIDGVFDTAQFLQSDGVTRIGETGLLFDAFGETYIANSVLEVNGEIDTLLMSVLDSEVTGTGIISAPFGVFQAGGVIVPGLGDAGGDALTILGDYTLIDGTLVTRLGALGASQLLIAGAANLTGELFVSHVQGFMPMRNTRHVFAVAENGFGVTDLTLANPQLTPVLSYAIDFAGTEAALTIEARAYADFAVTDQMRAVAGALDGALAGDAVPTGALGELAGTLDYMPTVPDLQAALQSAHPGETFAMDRMGFGIARTAGDTVAARVSAFQGGRRGGLERVGSAGEPLRLAAFGLEGLSLNTRALGAQNDGPYSGLDRNSAVYVFTDIGWGEADVELDTFDIEEAHLTIGVDHAVNEHWMLGANLGFSDYEARVSTGGATLSLADGESVSITGYAGFAAGAWYGAGYVGAAWSEHELARTVFVAGQELYPNAETDADHFNAGFDVGARFDLGAVQAGPVLKLRHGQMDIEAYRETGAGVFNAGVGPRDADQTLLGAGVHAGLDADLGGGQLSAFGQLTWEQDISEGEGAVAASLEGAPGATFPVTTIGRDDSFLSLAVGVSLQATERLALTARIRTDFDRDTDEDNAASLGFNWRF